MSDDDKINHYGRTRGSAPTILSLSDIVKHVKTLTTKKYIDGIKNNAWQPFNKRLWQRNYHDHIIRNDKSLRSIRTYIRANPQTWNFDLENPNRGLDRNLTTI
ncbi:MAG: transposase [Candidatus Omnitrophota bacterium]